jgi:LemA protein
MGFNFAWIVIGVPILAALFVVIIYNRLVALRNQVKNAWAQVDVQLKRRHDLIPNLIETAKGYMAHERGVFEEVTKARNQAMGATGVAAAAEAENMLTSTLRSLFAVAEAYPDLKANQNMLAVQWVTTPPPSSSRETSSPACLGSSRKPFSRWKTPRSGKSRK